MAHKPGSHELNAAAARDADSVTYGVDNNATSAAHSDFSSAWLSLRESADHRARDRHALVTQALAPFFDQKPHKPLEIVDLGCGSGSNLRYLAGRLERPQHWHLLDQDAALLERARQSPLDARVKALNACRVDLADLSSALSPLKGVHPDLVSASALLDLVSERWLSCLADECRDRGSAVLLALSINGDNTIEVEPQAQTRALRALDDEVQRLIARHQRRDKGFDGALGTEAPTRAAALFAERGFEVSCADAPWQLDSRHVDEAALIRALLKGWCESACEEEKSRREALESWYQKRLAAVAQGALRLRVGHTDLFAQPMASDRRA